MSSLAAALIVVSALMHAVWNLVSKRQDPSLAFFFLATGTAAVLLLPLLFVYRQTLLLIPIFVWGLVLATGIAQAIYFFGLTGAYRRGDISLAYPLVRAMPVLLVTLVSMVGGGAGDIGRMGLAGMGLVILGCIILPLPQFQKLQLRHYADALYLMAFIAAIGTAGYTLIDDHALRQLRGNSAIQLENGELTLLFVVLQTISTAMILGCGTLLYQSERRHLLTILHNRTVVFSGMFTGIVMMVTYGLVLASMGYVTNVSYVAAFRQLSIPIGAVLGIALLKEPRYLPKLVGVGIVSVGLLLVGIG